MDRSKKCVHVFFRTLCTFSVLPLWPDKIIGRARFGPQALILTRDVSAQLFCPLQAWYHYTTQTALLKII